MTKRESIMRVPELMTLRIDGERGFPGARRRPQLTIGREWQDVFPFCDGNPPPTCRPGSQRRTYRAVSFFSSFSHFCASLASGLLG